MLYERLTLLSPLHDALKQNFYCKFVDKSLNVINELFFVMSLGYNAF